MKHLRNVAIIILMACLVGCAGKPTNMDQNTYDLGCKALQIMESYNKMEIDEDSAYNQLGNIYDMLKAREYEDSESDQELQNGLVTTYILCYQVDMTAGNDLVKAADNLREVLNK